MLLLVTYDVAVDGVAGAARLRRVAKVCRNWGQRVQNSVFECHVDNAQKLLLISSLEAVIDRSRDSLRFYNLGDHYQNRIEHVGAKPAYDPEDYLEV